MVMWECSCGRRGELPRQRQLLMPSARSERRRSGCGRQPKARSTKSTARIKQFYELTAKARDVPQAEVSVDFDGETKMKRQVRVPMLILCILSEQ